MADTQRDLVDEDGENRALRTFLMQYGLPGLTVGAMRDHMKRSGWGGEYWPFFVSASNRDTHLTKGGAQVWIRHLLGMEVASRPAEVDDEGLPALPESAKLTIYELQREPYFTAEQYRQGQRDAVAAHKRAESFCEANCCWSGHHVDCFRSKEVEAPSHTTNKEK